MKKAALFATILALALGASAQNISFAGLPAVSNPTLFQNAYSDLNPAPAADTNGPVTTTVGPTAPRPVLDPPPHDQQISDATWLCWFSGAPCAHRPSPTAPKKPGPVAHEAENLIADRGVVSPPIIVITPTAPKNPGPVAHEADSIVADNGTQPIVIGPTAPKKPGPVAHAAGNTVADNGTQPIVIGPTAPKKPGPVAHAAGNIVADNGTQPIVIGPTAPKKPGPVAHAADGESV